MSKARAQVFPGLVPAHWWVHMDPRISGYRAPVLVSAPWWVGPVPDTSGYRFWGVLNLV